jgi:methionine aminotransferase
LPDTGTTIFTVMSALAAQHGAINLSQGFPDYAADPGLLSGLNEAAQAGHNQYAPMTGLSALRQAIGAKLDLQHGLKLDPDHSITVTAGATQAIFCALATVLHAGDEAILFDPSYDCYAPGVLAQGARPVRIALTAPHFTVDWDQVERAVTPRTRLIMINNPNNPATSVMSTEDLDALARVVRRHNLVVLSDEVYEHLVFDGRVHRTVLTHPELAERSFAFFSFGKTFHVTGWKVGYCVAPKGLTAEFRKIHQFLVFSVNSPAQHTIAAHLADPQHWRVLPSFFESRRDRLAIGLKRAGFELLPCRGTYFQLADYSQIRPDLEDDAFARWLTEEYRVACIPISAFYGTPPPGQRLVRFCFAKRTETIDAAIERLTPLSSRASGA